MTNVLVTSASRKVLLVRAFQAALRELGEGMVVAADVSPMSAALYVADVAELVPRSDDPGFVDAVVAICERHSIGLIVPTRDEELSVFADARERLESIGARVAVADRQVIDTCQDKRAFHRFCLSHRIGVPRMFDDHERVEYPAFVRPRRGKGGAGAGAVQDAAGLRAAIERIGDDVLVQELVDAPEYTIDLCTGFDGAFVSAVARRRVEIVSGESWVGRVEMHDDLVREAKRLASVMSFRGHVTIQCFRTPDGALLIEVNPRFGGAAALGWAAGAPTPAYLVRLARGEAVQHDPAGIRNGLTMLRHSDDLYLMPDELIGGVE